ncbi:1-acyl-sn-glycerol-3-phosphate acyltransferase [Bacteroides sp. 51]|uniref:1-acyl-sn-glycerol-3-phosphate acyltransferase n=1 Tax=Bacteroides sp. 51 TaxID=2302938 RepID=UPI0013D6E97A|nr:1-acyl-sn-glycerol-3-phosphate acyltransferase [Bacteroides sp. 51]NDV84498.1 hypothetical protein [Bacteroides sp. 51]
MGKNKDKKNAKAGWLFNLFKGYMRFCHDHFYYKKVYWVGTENIPEGCPLMVVSHHQNCLSDALGVLFSIKNREDRQLRILSRADVFKPVFEKALRWLGIMPAFRLEYDGADSLSNNSYTISESGDELLEDGVVIIYPEAGHQDKRWMGTFSLGYLHIIFEAAKKSNFEKEMFIIPSCNHYSDYFDPREHFLVKYGEPISLKPYYELYQTKPRTVQRQVNALVREKINELMLNITDLENYEAIDYLRNTYGIDYAKQNGFNPEVLPEKLLADKMLYAELDNLKNIYPEEVQVIYENTCELKEKSEEMGIGDRSFAKRPNTCTLFLKGFGFILLFPLFILGCIPNYFVWLLPTLATRRIKDRMFHSGIHYAAMMLITMPFFYLLTFALLWIFTKSVIITLVYILCFPFLGIFAWNYVKQWKLWRSDVRFKYLFGQGKLNAIIELRTHIYNSLDKLLKGK